ncbi:hypothetical protein [Pseudoalteromonas tetraodonis]|uniref:hypothetical protein n=1 Tax=Pseudoalteromonas tetraodonis TaxID=43659 RepID=UPI003A9875E8
MPKYQTDCCKFNLERSTDPSQTNSNFAIQHIQGVEDIYPIFRELFKKGRQQQGAA